MDRWSRNLIGFLLVFFILTDSSQSYRAVIPPDPENPGKCVYRGETLKLGTSPGMVPCQALTCQEDGTVTVEGCGKVYIPICNRGERVNYSKPFPECCMVKYKCKNPDGSSYYLLKDVLTGLTKTENST